MVTSVPDGQLTHIRHAQIARRVTLSHHFCIAEIANRLHIPRIPPRHEGRYGQSSRNVRRVAVDAIGVQRRSARDAFDEAVWSRHPDAGVKFRGHFPRSDGDYKARYAEESTE